MICCLSRPPRLGRSRRQREYRKLRMIAKRRGYKPGWAYYRFKDKFGVGPPEQFEAEFTREHAIELALRESAQKRKTQTWDQMDQATRRHSFGL